MNREISKSDEQWRQTLTPRQYEVCRCGGTEPPFTGEYVDCKDPGTYRCACCGEALFSSSAKYDSGTGWPSFRAPVGAAAVKTREDLAHGMRRVEVLCAGCDAHLGHVFDDGPPPEGARYCMNSAALQLDRGETGDDAKTGS